MLDFIWIIDLVQIWSVVTLNGVESKIDIAHWYSHLSKIKKDKEFW